MSGIVGQNLGRGSGLVKATSVTLGNDSIDSQHYVDASIDNAFLADNAVDTAEIADNAITLAKMAGGTDGNIISYNASGDPVAIATGSDGQVLTSTGAGSPPAFEAAAGGGKILQVVYDNSVSYQTITSQSYVDLTGLSQAITCSATSSKVFVILSLQGMGAVNDEKMRIYLARDINGGGYSSPLPSAVAVNELVSSYGAGLESVTHHFVDVPSSTDVVTYKVQGRSTDGANVYFNKYAHIGVGSSLTLFEIDGS